MIKSLNKIYDEDGLVYMCNAVGEINNPSTSAYDFTVYAPEDTMTPEEQDLYNNFWDDAPNPMYVLRVENAAAMGICFEFTDSWYGDFIAKETRAQFSKATIESLLWSKVLGYMEEIAEEVQDMAPDCDIYLSKNYDASFWPEMLVVIPYAQRNKISDIAQALEDFVWDEMEEKLRRGGMPNPSATFNSLPESCYGTLASTGEIILIKRGMIGYYKTDIDMGSKEENKALVDERNRSAGVSKAQVEAMSAGSMFGWDIPAADPDSYDENGSLKA